LCLPRVEQFDQLHAHGVVNFVEGATENARQVVHHQSRVKPPNIFDNRVHYVERDELLVWLYLLDAALDRENNTLRERVVLNLICRPHGESIDHALVRPLHRV